MKSTCLALLLLLSFSAMAQEVTTNQKVQDFIAKTETPKSLSEVTVYGNKRQFIKVESDKTTINVKINPMRNSGSSLDTVKKNPVSNRSGIFYLLS
jgi:iron complex outermembrane receptor protein